MIACQQRSPTSRTASEIPPTIHARNLPADRSINATAPFGIKGRRWLAEQQLPPDEQTAALALLRQLDFQGEELALIDADLARVALGSRASTAPLELRAGLPPANGRKGNAAGYSLKAVPRRRTRTRRPR
jgi:hypothetical protein